MKIGQNLKRIMKEKEIRVVDLADRLGLGVGVVYMYLQGNRYPSMKALMSICKELGVTPNDLLL